MFSPMLGESYSCNAYFSLITMNEIFAYTFKLLVPLPEQNAKVSSQPLFPISSESEKQEFLL